MDNLPNQRIDARFKGIPSALDRGNGLHDASLMECSAKMHGKLPLTNHTTLCNLPSAARHKYKSSHSVKKAKDMQHSKRNAKRRRTRQPAMTRERLINAAASVICERGFEAATTAEITERAGLTNGALYAHFSNKDELLTAALKHNTSRARKRILEVDRSSDSAIDKLEMLFLDWKSISLPEEDNFTAEFLARARRDPVVKAICRDLTKGIEATFVRWLRAGQKDGDVRRDIKPEAAARLLSSIGVGYTTQANAGITSIDAKSWSSILRCVLDSFRTDKR
jgi:AcrR family transcriptional regulator